MLEAINSEKRTGFTHTSSQFFKVVKLVDGDSVARTETENAEAKQRITQPESTAPQRPSNKAKNHEVDRDTFEAVRRFAESLHQRGHSGWDLCPPGPGAQHPHTGMICVLQLHALGHVST